MDSHFQTPDDSDDSSTVDMANISYMVQLKCLLLTDIEQEANIANHLTNPQTKSCNKHGVLTRCMVYSTAAWQPTV